MRLKPSRLLILAFTLIAAAMTSASAADWPTRPVKFLVTLGAGSGADIGARAELPAEMPPPVEEAVVEAGSEEAQAPA